MGDAGTTKRKVAIGRRTVVEHERSVMATAVFGNDAVERAQSRDRLLGLGIDWIKSRLGDHAAIAEQVGPADRSDLKRQITRLRVGNRWVIGPREFRHNSPLTIGRSSLVAQPQTPLFRVAPIRDVQPSDARPRKPPFVHASQVARVKRPSWGLSCQAAVRNLGHFSCRPSIAKSDSQLHPTPGRSVDCHGVPDGSTGRVRRCRPSIWQNWAA